MGKPIEIRIELTRFIDEDGQPFFTAYQMQEYYNDCGWVNFGDQGYIAELEENILQMAEELSDEYHVGTKVTLITIDEDLMSWYRDNNSKGNYVGSMGDDDFNILIKRLLRHERDYRQDQLANIAYGATLATFCDEHDILMFESLELAEEAYKKYLEENNQGE